MKLISRRTVLRGAGACLGLPWLNAMGAAPSAPPRRFAFIYIPNGVLQSTWTPATAGPAWELTPALEPLAKVRSEVSVISGLDRTYVSGTGVHAQCGSCWLTSSPPAEALDGGFPTNTSVDQLLARAAGETTLVPSLELSCNDHADDKETRYFESISWIAPGYAANVEKNPRAVYQRLFGDANRDPGYRGLLDAVLSDARRLRSTLGKSDQSRLDEYLESVRSIERRIEVAERVAATRRVPSFPQPEGIPEDRGSYIRLMFDLLAAAFEQDLTRVATVVIDPERWDTPRWYHGLLDKPEDHHGLTHAKGEDPKIKLTKIDNFHVSQFAYLVERLRGIREGEGSVLHHSALVMGSGLGDGSVHSYKDLPVLVAGRAGGSLRAGSHVKYAPGTPLANLWLTLLDTGGVKRDRLADSSGRLREILA